jgi:hypothetical protein
MKKLLARFVCLYLAFASSANCQSTITFDDLPTGGPTGYISIPNGYQGFNWNNFGAQNTTGLPLSGLLNGTVSAPNVAFSFVGSTASFFTANPFLLVSGYFTSGARNGMTLEVTGLNGSTPVFDQTFSLDVYGPSFLTFPSSPVTEVDFVTSGGVFAGTNYVGGGAFMAMDNLTVFPVPEPSAALLCAAGLGALALRRKLWV